MYCQLIALIYTYIDYCNTFRLLSVIILTEYLYISGLNNYFVIFSTVNGKIIAIKQTITVAMHDVDNHILKLYKLGIKTVRIQPS